MKQREQRSRFRTIAQYPSGTTSNTTVERSKSTGRKHPQSAKTRSVELLAQSQAEAEQQAAEILEQAKKEGFQQGKEAGYQEGFEKGMRTAFQNVKIRYWN